MMDFWTWADRHWFIAFWMMLWGMGVAVSVGIGALNLASTAIRELRLMVRGYAPRKPAAQPEAKPATPAIPEGWTLLRESTVDDRFGTVVTRSYLQPRPAAKPAPTSGRSGDFVPGMLGQTSLSELASVRESGLM